MNLFVAATFAICLQAPVPGPVVEQFAPVGQFGGHWGVDFAAPVGTVVGSPVAGRVSFAGTVAGMRTVTVDPGGGILVSVSYLTSVTASPGEVVRVGEELGRSGVAHGRPAVHLSLREHGRYLDPAPYFSCRRIGHVYLLPPPQASTYPGLRAQRSAWRNLRPTPHRPSAGRRGRLSPTWP
ncbi:MAG: peptidoglycan DD-metalloendopeptidase family protein [Acidimicrobiia bacterium]